MSEPSEESRFDFIMRLIREVEAVRIKDAPVNELSYVYLEGHEMAIDDMLNILRKEL